MHVASRSTLGSRVAACVCASKRWQRVFIAAMTVGGSLLARRREKAKYLSDISVDCSVAAKAHLKDCIGDINEYYDVLETIGRGSASVVYRGVHRSSGEQVALKVVNTLDEAKVAIAKAEFQLLQSINHPGIVRALDFFMTRKGAVLALSFFAGKSLNVAVQGEKEKRIGESTARELFVALLQALDCLHAKQLVHRDVKPENVLVLPDFSGLQLIDFNVATSIPENGFLSPAASPAYAAPEIHMGGSPSEASDIWGAGLCLNLMLTGRCPCVRVKDGKVSVTPHDFKLLMVSKSCQDTLHQCLLVDHSMRPSTVTLLPTPWVLHGPEMGPENPQEGD